MNKIMVILSVIVPMMFIVTLTATAQEQEKIEVPIWNVGDEWTKRSDDGRVWTVKVVEVTDKEYILQNFGNRDNGKTGFDKKTLNCTFIERNYGRNDSNIMFEKLFNFPMIIGKPWGERGIWMTEVKSGTYPKPWLFEYLPLGKELITTPAGSFQTVKIQVKGMRTEENYDEHFRHFFWYSTEVKTWVKRYQGEKRKNMNSVLVSYKLSDNLDSKLTK